MTQEEINKINNVLKNFNNIKILLNDLLTPIPQIQQQYKCTKDSAVNMKIHAEEYLTKYGILTLDASIKAIQKIIKDNNDDKQNTVKVIQMKFYDK